MCVFTLFVEAMARAWLRCLRNLSAENLSHLPLSKAVNRNLKLGITLVSREQNISIIRYHNSFSPSSISRRASTPHKCDSVRFAYALSIPSSPVTRAAQRASYWLARNSFFSFQIIRFVSQARPMRPMRQSTFAQSYVKRMLYQQNILALALSLPP